MAKTSIKLKVSNNPRAYTRWALKRGGLWLFPIFLVRKMAGDDGVLRVFFNIRAEAVAGWGKQEPSE